MDSTTSALLGAAIGSAAALVSASLASFVALHNERKRREEAARASAVRSLRTAAAAAFTEFYNFSHAISWITWYARHDPASVDAQMAGSYEQENHAVIPKLQGALAVVASLSLTVYEELQPLVHRLFVLDKHVSTAVVKLRDDRAGAIASLRTLLDDVDELQDSLPAELNRVMKVALSEF